MSVNPGSSGDGARRRSPDELAQQVASLLKKGSTGDTAQRRRFDIVTVSRIVMVVGVVVFGVGIAVAVPWIGGLAGYESPGMVTQGGPVVGCPGELEIGEVFTGETVQVVGRTDDGLFYALRDERGPGDVVYGDASAITVVEEGDRLPTRSCEPRDDAVVLAAATTVGPGDPIPTTTTTVTTIAGDTSTTIGPAADPEVPVARPPRRRTSSPGAPVTTTPPSTAPIGAGPATTTPPGASTTTTRPPSSSSTSTSTTTTTRPPTTSSSTTTTTTIEPTTTTTTEPTTTTTEVTTTTEPEPTTTVP
jgi:hypothetical protein